MVRRASFDVLRRRSPNTSSREIAPAALIDPLTTLHTRSVFVAALEKEIQRAERFGHPFALILFDVDHLAEINATHGYGAGDRIIERIGITIRNYFRETDWVARTAGDTFAVLLPEIQRVNAERLADRVRNMVRERLAAPRPSFEHAVPGDRVGRRPDRGVGRQERQGGADDG